MDENWSAFFKPPLPSTLMSRIPAFFSWWSQICATETLSDKGFVSCISEADGPSQLVQAAGAGRVDRIKLLLQYNKAPVDVVTDDGESTLTIAAHNGQVDVVKVLLDFGAHVELLGLQGCTPLVCAAQEKEMKMSFDCYWRGTPRWTLKSQGTIRRRAAEHGRLKVVQLLMERGANVNLSCENGDTALIRAASRGHLDAVKELLEMNAGVNAQADNGDTSLTRAANKGHLDIARALIESGSNTELADNEGFTPLVCAAKEGYLEVVRLLIDSDVGVDVANSEGTTPLILAAERGHADVITLLIESKAAVDHRATNGDTALIQAAFLGRFEATRALVEGGAAIDLAHTDGFTPLMCAAQEGYATIVEYLLQQGASVNAQSVEGERATTISTLKSHVEIKRLLLEYGADVSLGNGNNCSPLLSSVDSDNDGDTALHECVYEKQLGCARTLLENGADPNLRNNVGFSPLMTSAQLGHLELVKLLIEYKADVHATNNSDRTALLLAAEEAVVEVLLKHGADIEAVDESGQTALMKAAYRGHEQVLRVLLENKANTTVTDSANRTATNCAQLNNRIDAARVITSYLLEHPVSDYSSGIESAVLSNPIARKTPEWFLPSREIRKEKDPFSFGSLGKVYRGWWLNSNVVVKCVVVESEKEKQAFHREARIWHQARHPNILPFIGASDKGKPYFFVCEEATNGNLLDYLYRERNEGRSFVWRKLHEAALGLLFLHERGIVHSDLKCNQILVSKDGVAMLTDFGLGFDSADVRGVGETLGSIRWKAPEVTRKIDRSTPTLQSDIYSFGVCIVEAVTGRVPWGNLPDPVVKFHVSREQFLPKPKDFRDDGQWNLVKALCAFDPSHRMRLSDAVAKLQHLAQEQLIQERISEYNEETASELKPQLQYPIAL